MASRALSGLEAEVARLEALYDGLGSPVDQEAAREHVTPLTEVRGELQHLIDDAPPGLQPRLQSLLARIDALEAQRAEGDSYA